MPRVAHLENGQITFRTQEGSAPSHGLSSLLGRTPPPPGCVLLSMQQVLDNGVCYSHYNYYQLIMATMRQDTHARSKGILETKTKTKKKKKTVIKVNDILRYYF